jgi:predicted ABC-type ATPase
VGTLESSPPHPGSDPLPQKELLVVGGPNGAGKSTLVAGLLSDEPRCYLSADKIALELPIAEPLSLQFAAGEEFLRQCENQLSRDESFIIETTLSGRAWTKYLHRAKSAGFHIGILFVFLDSADTCIARVDERVRRGGHHVPDDDVRRRFRRSLANFWTLYRKIADHWTMLYNVGSSYAEIAFGIEGEFVVADESLFRQFFELAEVDQNG